jgi:hypothetical protein
LAIGVPEEHDKVTQSFKIDADDLAGRLKLALAGTHGRDVLLGSVRSLVAIEVAEWNSERRQPATNDIPLIGHPIRLTST